MEALSLSRSVQAGQLPLEKLAGNANVSESAKIDEVCRQFEAVLLRQILASAQKPLLDNSMSSSSTTGTIYQDMVVSQLADHISRSGSFGLSQVLQPQLSREADAEKKSNSPESL